MSKHIGIVGCSAEGAALCYRTICEEGAHALGAYAHPEVTLHTPSLARYVDCLNGGDLAGVAELMLASARKLAAAGADFLICPDNTIHHAFELMAPRSPLPWLHIADVVAAEAAARGFQRVGLTGRAGWSTAPCIRTGWPRAASLACGPARTNAARSTASSWKNWCRAWSSRTAWRASSPSSAACASRVATP